MINAIGAIPHYISGGTASATTKADATPASSSGDDKTTLSSRTQRFLAARGLSSEERSNFDALLSRAAEQKAAQDPVAFLDGLDAGERALLQKAHALADPIKASQLGREGAANLLRYPGDGLDTDNDGFVTYGMERTFEFPPSSAPAGVKAAWEEATAGMSDLDRVSAEGMFLPLMLRVDDAGNVTSIEPGDADYSAPYSGADFSYTDLVRQRTESLEVTRKFGKISPEQYARDKLFLARFGDALAERGFG